MALKSVLFPLSPSPPLLPLSPSPPLLSPSPSLSPSSPPSLPLYSPPLLPLFPTFSVVTCVIQVYTSRIRLVLLNTSCVRRPLSVTRKTVDGLGNIPTNGRKTDSTWAHLSSCALWYATVPGFTDHPETEAREGGGLVGTWYLICEMLVG